MSVQVGIWARACRPTAFLIPDTSTDYRPRLMGPRSARIAANLKNSVKDWAASVWDYEGDKMERGLVSFKDLVIGERAFEIPIYQRNYSWIEKQWDDLWNDLLYLKGNRNHYFGTLLMKRPKKFKKSGLKSFEIFEIIDGQQRIATTTILLKEIISKLKELTGEDMKDEITRLEEDYLKYKDVYKLQLLGDDQDFFRRHVIDDEEYPDEIQTPSQRRLRDAKRFFKDRVEALKSTSEEREYRDVVMDLKDKIDKMEVLRYEVENDADAVLIFETVNDRGKVLTELEKTKSFLMHTAYLSATEGLEGHLDRINKSFSSIFRWFEEAKNIERGKRLKEDDIQRYHFIIFEPDPKNRREESFGYLTFLKAKVRNLYRQDDEKKALDYSLEYAKDLEKAFFALKRIITYNKHDDIGERLERVFALGRVANFYPLMISSWIRFKDNPGRIVRILDLIEKISFRVYAIRRRRADAGESWLCETGYGTYSDKWTFDEIVKDLEDILNYFEKEEDFKGDLRIPNFYKRVRARDRKFLLYEYEKHLRDESGEPLDLKLDDVLSPKFEVEHVWANDPSRLDLDEDLTKVHEEFRHKLGNLTLASKSWNARWGNSPFKVKRNEYKNSILRVQKELSDCRDWGKDEIEKRENEIVDFCVKRWRA